MKAKRLVMIATMLLNILTSPLYGQNLALSDAEYSDLVTSAEQGNIEAIIALAEHYRMNSMEDIAKGWYDKAIELGGGEVAFGCYLRTSQSNSVRSYSVRHSFNFGKKKSWPDETAQSYLLKAVELGYPAAETEYAKQLINRCIYNQKRYELEVSLKQRAMEMNKEKEQKTNTLNARGYQKAREESNFESSKKNIEAYMEQCSKRQTKEYGETAKEWKEQYEECERRLRKLEEERGKVINEYIVAINALERELSVLRKSIEEEPKQREQAIKDFEDEALRTGKDVIEAAKLFRKAAENGFVTAQIELGYLYAHGYGVDKDSKEAAKWFAKAAEQDNPIAQFNLSLCYYKGFGVENNPETAFALMEKAAIPGRKEALKNLSYFYSHGVGVEKNFKKSQEICPIVPEYDPRSPYLTKSNSNKVSFYDEFKAGEIEYQVFQNNRILALLEERDAKKREQRMAEERRAEERRREAEQARKREAIISLTQKIVEMGNQRREEERRQRIDNNLQQSIELQRRLQQHLEDREIDRRMQRKTYPW